MLIDRKPSSTRSAIVPISEFELPVVRALRTGGSEEDNYDAEPEYVMFKPPRETSTKLPETLHAAFS